MTTVGRNEACTCGSGKKYKRCCGVNAEPILNTPKMASDPQASLAQLKDKIPGMPEGFDPSQLDPAMLKNVGQALQRLPRGQMQQLQGIMQKAMSGKDISEEAGRLEQLLPPEFKSMMMQFAGSMGGLDSMAAVNGTDASPLTHGQGQNTMTPEEAQRIVEEAAKAGKIDANEAADLIKNAGQTEKAGAFSKLMGAFKKK
jgi:hypothetical protein